jgi:hypothetical protein
MFAIDVKFSKIDCKKQSADPSSVLYVGIKKAAAFTISKTASTATSLNGIVLRFLNRK